MSPPPKHEPPIAGQVESIVNDWAEATGNGQYRVRAIAPCVWECLPVDGGQRHLVAKWLPPGKSVQAIAAVQAGLRDRSPLLRNGLVEIPGHIEESRLLLMQYAGGRTLLDLARAAGPVATTLSAFRDSGEILREITNTTVPDLPAGSPRSNESFFADLERRWSQASWLLPREYRSVAHFLSGFPTSWRLQHAHRLLPVDFQPKNILIGPGGIVAIDPAYVAGPPALAIASFLVTLDIDLRGPFLLHRRFTEACKAAFLSGAGVGERDAVTPIDLRFFVSWVLLDQLERARTCRPRMQYLARLWYSAVVRSHLRSVSPVGHA